MITNEEAKDIYLEAYKQAKDDYDKTVKDTEALQNTISEKRASSQRLEDGIRCLQNAADEYTELKNKCKWLREDKLEDEKNKIADYAKGFKNSISHSEVEIDVEGCYSPYITNIGNQLDDMIKKSGNLAASLNDRKKVLSDQKATADEELNKERIKYDNLESLSSINARMEENYHWYKYYEDKIETEGGEADSGLY